MDMIYGQNNDNASHLCPNGSYLYEMFYPVSWKDNFGAAFAYIIAFLNILTFYMFWKAKKVMVSPVTCLLLLLAVTDSMAALCSFLPPHLGMLLNLIQKETSLIHYDYCLTYTMVNSLFFFIFHDLSVLITVSVGIVKVIVIRFPIYCNRSLTKRKVLAVTAMFTPFVIVGELIFSFEYDFAPSNDGMCCKYYSEAGYLRELQKAGMWMVTVFYVFSVVSMIGSTTFIVVKLTCQRYGHLRSTSEVHESTEARKNKNQAAAMLVLVTVIFLLSDFMELLALFSMVLTEQYGVPSLFIQDWFVQMFAWQRCIAEVGYASNFFIYLFVSQYLRNALKPVVCKN